MAKKIDIDTLLKRIEALESRLDKLDPIVKENFLTKKIKLVILKITLMNGLKSFHQSILNLNC